MDYFTTGTSHYWSMGDWSPGSCPPPMSNMYMQYASESQAPVMSSDISRQRNHDRQPTADGRSIHDYDYAMHGPPTTWRAGTTSTEPAQHLEPASSLELYYDYHPAYAPTSPNYYARHSTLYIDTQVQESSPLFPSSSANSSPVTPLHTDEAFARMQRQSSGYIPSISTALNAPISRRPSAVGAHQSTISRPSSIPAIAPTPRSPPMTKDEPDSPVLSPSPEPSAPVEEPASPKRKPKTAFLYTSFRFQSDKQQSTSAAAADGTDQSEASSTEPSTPPLKVPEIAQPTKRVSRPRRTQHLACFFCRRRKIACVAPDTEDPERTCNQCERRGLSCSFPSESHRGLRYKARDTGRRSATSIDET